jgi:predicted flap endonuclease-1-like 5' DNA nuclease
MMTQSGMAQNCQMKCWGLAAALGFVAMIFALVAGDYGWGTSLFLGLLVVVLSGLLLTWLMCAEVPKLGQSARAKGISSGAGTAGAGSGSTMPASSAGGGAAAPAAAPKPAAPVAATAKADEVATKEPANEVKSPTKATAAAAGSAATDKNGASVVKPSVALAGEAELSSRKGTWKYDGGATETVSAEVAARPDKKKKVSSDEGTTQATAGSRPEALDAARGGKADDLKQIKGIGPKLEKLCNSLGFYHFDQIASWTTDEVAWMDANLEGFRGRVTRDEWVAQAKLLAEGGETEFSKRVDKGGVY